MAYFLLCQSYGSLNFSVCQHGRFAPQTENWGFERQNLYWRTSNFRIFVKSSGNEHFSSWLQHQQRPTSSYENYWTHWKPYNQRLDDCSIIHVDNLGCKFHEKPELNIKYQFVTKVSKLCHRNQMQILWKNLQTCAF